MRKIYITESQFEKYIHDNVFDDVIYIGVFLDQESKNKLYQTTKNLVFNHFGENVNFVCHHMTVSHISKINDYIKQWCIEHNGEDFEISTNTIGFNDKACAVKVDTTIPCTQNYPHITVATNNTTGGKPVDSNFITVFEKLPENLILKGKLTFWYNLYTK